MTSEANILKFIGLAMRAGAVVSGFDAVASEIRRGNGKLIITAQDISANTMNKLLDLAMKIDRDMPDCYSFGTRDKLGQAIGRPDRAILLILNDGFANKLSAMFEDYEALEENA